MDKIVNQAIEALIQPRPVSCEVAQQLINYLYELTTQLECLYELIAKLEDRYQCKPRNMDDMDHPVNI